MANTSNLSSFLTDVADAIREKKGTQDQIPAENFDTEIKSIETGIDTSDATATSEDIMQGKTAYVDGEKITGSITTQTETGTNLESYKELTNLTSYTGYQINDYDLRNSLYVRNNGSTSIQIGRINGNNIETVSKTISNTTLNNTNIGTVYITDAKFSKVYDENYIKLFVSTRECKSGQGYPSYGCIYLLKLNKETLEIETKYRTYYENYLDADTAANWMKNGALTVHPLKDIAICVFFGTANGVQMRYMSSLYNENTDSFTRILGGSQGCGYYNNASFVNSYITNDGYVTYTYGTSSSAYETTIFRINNDNIVSLVTKLSANTMRWYTNNGTYITNTGLYSTSGTKIKDITLEGLNGASRVQLLDNLFIYSNRTNGSATSSTIKMAYTNNDNLVALDMMFREKHPIFYVKDTNVIISNPSNTLVNLYRPSDKVVTAITYRSNNYYSGLKNTAVASDLLIGKTAVSKGLEIVGTMPNNGELIYTPSTEEQTIPAGYISGGIVEATTSNVDSNIIPTNIKKGVEILGVLGTLDGSGLPQPEIYMGAEVETSNSNTRTLSVNAVIDSYCYAIIYHRTPIQTFTNGWTKFAEYAQTDGTTSDNITIFYKKATEATETFTITTSDSSVRLGGVLLSTRYNYFLPNIVYNQSPADQNTNLNVMSQDIVICSSYTIATDYYKDNWSVDFTNTSYPCRETNNNNYSRFNVFVPKETKNAHIVSYNESACSRIIVLRLPNNMGEENLVPENIKKGVQIFNVTGTLETSTSGGVKLFKTKEEMNSSTGNVEGDLAVVYGTSYVGTYRLNNGTWTQIGNSTEE